jgi:formylglycine-generating enzyme required for sulfatase activity
VTWHEAAAYCNWLSKEEGIPEDQWCYLPNHEGKYATGMKLAPDYLKRTGYRLPTEAEWEHACRAGAHIARSRFFWETDKYLGSYAWYRDNAKDQISPVGKKMPNDLGLFDMYGNAWEWCQDRLLPYPQGTREKPAEDREDSTTVVETELRVMRGGGIDSRASELRSAFRKGHPPGERIPFAGFRVARTLPTQ